MKPIKIDPKNLSSIAFYELACGSCDLRFNNLPTNRKVYIGQHEVAIKRDPHQECASCFANFLSDLYKEGEVFYLV